MKPSAKVNTVLGCIDEDIGVGGSCHRRLEVFVVLFVPSSRTGSNLKFLRAKKEAQEAFDDEIN
jgi:hypothetical protein